MKWNNKQESIYQCKYINKRKGSFIVNPITHLSCPQKILQLKSKSWFDNQSFSPLTIDYTYKNEQSFDESQILCKSIHSNKKNNDFFFEKDWKQIAPVIFQMKIFRKLAPEFSVNPFESQSSDLFVKILLLYSKILPKRLRNRPDHDFMIHFTDLKSRK